MTSKTDTKADEEVETGVHPVNEECKNRNDVLFIERTRLANELERLEGVRDAIALAKEELRALEAAPRTAKGNLRKATKLEVARVQADIDALNASVDGPLRMRVSQTKRALDDITYAIVMSNMGLVVSYASRFKQSATRDEIQDFQDAGQLGLMQAVATYQVGMSTFAGWAFQRIRSEVLKAVKTAGHPGLSAEDFARRPVIKQAERDIRVERGDEYTPTYDEVAERTGYTVKQVGRVLNPPQIDSMSTPTMRDQDGGGTLADTLPDVGVDIAAEVLQSMDEEAARTFGLEVLDERERFVIVNRFDLRDVGSLNQDRDAPGRRHLADLGDELGLSREAVRQIESRALAKMRHPIVLRKMVRAGRITNEVPTGEFAGRRSE